MSKAILFRWDGEAMIPVDRYRKMADREFIVGETYSLVAEEERSSRSHRHYFASIHNAWLTLPERLTDEFTSSERLRKRALIATGWYTERRFVASSDIEADKFAEFLRLRPDDGTVVGVAGNVVIERVARSQSTGPHGMRKAEFQKSKDDVLDWIAALVGVAPSSLAANSPSIAPETPRGHTDPDTLAQIGRGRVKTDAGS